MARFLRFAAGSVRFNIWKDRLSDLPAVFFSWINGVVLPADASTRHYSAVTQLARVVIVH